MISFQQWLCQNYCMVCWSAIWLCLTTCKAWYVFQCQIQFLYIYIYIHIYIYIYIYHHHHIALVARISPTLSRHSSLSFIALGRSSGQHPGRNISILVSMSLSPINLKCWILQNVMLYFVCEIMLKLCVLNVKTRLLYYKAKLMLSLFPNVSEQGRMFLNLFYNII